MNNDKHNLLKKALFDSFRSGISLTNYSAYACHEDEIPEAVMKNVLRTIAQQELESEAVIGLLDSSLLANGRDGILFTDEGLFVNMLTNADGEFALRYDDIMELRYHNDGDEVSLEIIPQHGRVRCIDDRGVSKKKTMEFLQYAVGLA